MNRPVREEVDDLIVRTREAHEVLRDIKTAIKELKETIKLAQETQEKLGLNLLDIVNEGIGQAVEVGLQTYHNAIDESIQEAQRAIYQRFDMIAAIMLGEAGDMEDAARLLRISLADDHTPSTLEQWKMDEMCRAMDRRIRDFREERP